MARKDDIFLDAENVGWSKVLAFAYREVYEGNTDKFNPDDQCPDGARQEYPGRVMGIESQQT